MNIFRQFFAYLRLREAVRKADAAWRASGSRHYVIPSAGRKLLVMDRNNFRILKRKGYISKTAILSDALRECFYHTPHRDGSGRISEAMRLFKIKQYFSWYADQVKQEKQQKNKL